MTKRDEATFGIVDKGRRQHELGFPGHVMLRWNNGRQRGENARRENVRMTNS